MTRRRKLLWVRPYPPKRTSSSSENSFSVMAGLVPAIHDFLACPKDVDARDKPGHDEA